MLKDPLLTDESAAQPPTLNKKHLWQALAGLPGVPLHILSSLGVIELTESLPLTLATGVIGFALMNFSGQQFFREFYFTVKNICSNPKLGMETLITFSSYSAYLYATVLIFDEDLEDQQKHISCLFAAPLITLMAVNLSSFIDTVIQNNIERAQKSLRIEQQQKLPTTVTKTDNSVIDYDEIKQGMELKIAGLSTIPADGILFSKSAQIEESLFTGHSQTRRVEKGAELFAGSVLKSSDEIILQVTQNAGMSRLEQMLAELKNPKIDARKINDAVQHATNWFVPGVLFIAATTLAGWWIAGESELASLSCINVLCAACPCALSLATPISVSIVRHRAFKEGILIRNPHALALAPHIKTIAFDLNGTLTTITIDKLHTYSEDIDKNEVLKILYSLEKAANSHHPVAVAIYQFAVQNGVTETHRVVLEELTDKRGVAGKIGKQHYLLGSLDFIKDQGVTDLDNLNPDQGYLVRNKQLLVSLRFTSTLRPEATLLIQQLKQLSYALAIISGSPQSVCQTVAEQLGITEIYSEHKPDEKQKVIEKLTQPVLFVGDGTNDALAFKAAQASVAIGLRSDLTRSVDVTIPSDLNALLVLIQLAKSTMRNIKQNIALSIGYNSIMIALAAFIFPYLEMDMSPAMFGAAMALSSLLVVGNAARLAKGLPVDDTFAALIERELKSANQHVLYVTNATSCCTIRKLLTNATEIQDLVVDPPVNQRCKITFTSTMSATEAFEWLQGQLQSAGLKLECSENRNGMFSRSTRAITLTDDQHVNMPQ